jgi:GNAT superfamily N-acetyltransferase
MASVTEAAPSALYAHGNAPRLGWVEIRPARPEDAAEIDALVQRAYGHYVELIGGRPAPMDADYEEKVAEGGVFVADEGAVVGAIVLAEEHDHLLIENVAVIPERQGEGIGRALLCFAEQRAREARIDLLRLYTHALMSENLVIYARLGYREEKRRTDNGFERVFLVKRLEASEGGSLNTP